MLFYLLIVLVLAAFVLLFIYQRRQRKNVRLKRRTPVVDIDSLSLNKSKIVDEDSKVSKDSIDTKTRSPYNPNFVILQLNAFPGKPYMGYELHQALLSVGLRFGDKNIFHRYIGNNNKILFSLAAATSSGSFVVEDMGSFKCNGLLLFMHLDPKKKLMSGFDLMLDTARQLTEELGGEIYDDCQNAINAEVLKRLREKICEVETGNLYTSDLLDSLD